jgi:hypothetical protein
MRTRMFAREAHAPGSHGRGRWVPHGTYAGSLENCISWLPGNEGSGKLGQEYLLVEVSQRAVSDESDRGVYHEPYVSKVATVRIEQPEPKLVAVRI